MPGNKKSKKTSEGDISLRMEELSNHFQREMDRFKNELSQAQGIDLGGEGSFSLENLSVKFGDFQKSVNLDLENIRGQISRLITSLAEVKSSIDIIHQKHCKNKLLVYGIREEKDENFSNLIEVTLQTLNSGLATRNVVIDKNQLSDCYRYGKRHGSKNRPVLLEFTQAWNRNNVYFNKSALKGSKVVISELLTGACYDIYREAKKRYSNNCWTVNCRIFVNINGKKRTIRSLDDLNSDED